MSRENTPLVLVNALKLHQGPHRLPTGNFQHVLHLAAHLVRSKRFDVRLLTDQDSHGPLAERIEGDRLIPTPFKGNSILAADWVVAEMVKKMRPVIYHRPTGQLPFSRLPCRTVAGIADLSFMVLPHPWLKRLYKELSYRWTVRVADRIVCVSEFTRDEVAGRLAVPLRKLRVVHHGTNPLPGADFSLADRRGGDFFLVFAHQTHKNAEGCLQALVGLRKSHPNLGIALVGENEFIHRVIRPLVKALQLEDAVVFVGAPTAPQLAGLYLRARALLFPSRFEGFGLPVLEAMGAGCPVVCSNVCSLPEVAGTAALMVSPDDIAGLGQAMRSLVEDDVKRAALISAGHLQAARFSWRRAADLTETIYDELLD